MRENKNISRFTANEMQEKRPGSLTDWRKVDAMTDKGLDTVIAADFAERGFVPYWTKAELVLPVSKLSLNLRLDSEFIGFFKGQ